MTQIRVRQVQLTQSSITALLQLRMVGPFDVLVPEDLFQCPDDKHFFRFVAVAAYHRVSDDEWCSLVYLTCRTCAELAHLPTLCTVQIYTISDVVCR